MVQVICGQSPKLIRGSQTIGRKICWVVVLFHVEHSLVADGNVVVIPKIRWLQSTRKWATQATIAPSRWLRIF